MPVVSFLNTKGGAGKTTLSVHVARALELRGHKVLLIDTDPQGSSLDWAEANEGRYFSVVGIDRPVLEAEVKRFSRDYDWIIIDGAAKLEKIVVSALKASDLVIIPVKPSPLDIWAISDLVETVKLRQEVTDGIPVTAFQVSMAKKGTLLSTDVLEALSGYGLPIFEGAIHEKTAYPKAMATGSTAIDIDKAAEVEVNNLVDQIEGAFK